MILTIGLSLALVAGAPSTPTRDDAVERRCQTALARNTVPGFAVAVVKNDQAIHLHAYGIRELGKPDGVTIDDLFPLSSNTKAFTAVLAQQYGIVDDSVHKHLPNYHLSDANADALVSIRDLITHRTGIAGHDLLWYRSDWSNAEIVRRAAKLPPNGPFRAKYQYSTPQVMAVGEAVARVAGKPWEAVLQDRIFTPLQMRSALATSADPRFQNAPKATGHTRINNGPVQVVPRYVSREPDPAGSIMIAIRDLPAWMNFHLGDGTAHGNTVLTTRQLRELHAPQVVIPFDLNLRQLGLDTVQLSYALGWIVADHRGVRVLGHAGMIDGFRCIILLAPDARVGVAIMANSRADHLTQSLGYSILDDMLGLPDKDWAGVLTRIDDFAARQAERESARLLEQRKTLKPRQHAIEKYAGTFENASYGPATLNVENGELIFAWQKVKSRLEYWGDEQFRGVDGAVKERFYEFTGLNSFRFEGVEFVRK